MIRFYFPDAWPSFENKKIPFFFLSVIAIFWYYFFLTRKELKKQPEEVLDYLKLTHKASFIDYVNTLRIEAYKTRVKDEKYEHYDLVGLALECGFKSKSTFYRVFKQHEGIYS